MSKPIVKFSDTASLDKQLAQTICEILKHSIQAKGHANLALSGGSTPKGLFKLLAQQTIAWDKVNITLADERCVNPDAPDSNAKLLRSTLLSPGFLSAAANFIPLYQPVNNQTNRNIGTNQVSDKELFLVEQQLRQQRAFPFDVLVLGMGEDGHTASLFPCATTIENVMSKQNTALLSIITPTSAPYQRITFTYHALQQSSKVFLHLVGAAKLETLAATELEKNVLAMPIRAFLQNPDLYMEIYWAPKSIDLT